MIKRRRSYTKNAKIKKRTSKRRSRKLKKSRKPRKMRRSRKFGFWPFKKTEVPDKKSDEAPTEADVTEIIKYVFPKKLWGYLGQVKGYINGAVNEFILPSAKEVKLSLKARFYKFLLKLPGAKNYAAAKLDDLKNKLMNGNDETINSVLDKIAPNKKP